LERHTKFCVNCGAQIDARAEICPSCGIRQPEIKTSSGQEGRKFSYLGIVFAFLSLIVAAIIFGSLAVIFGTIGVLKGDTKNGIIAIVLGVVFSVFSFFIGLSFMF